MVWEHSQKTWSWVQGEKQVVQEPGSVGSTRLVSFHMKLLIGFRIRVLFHESQSSRQSVLNCSPSLTWPFGKGLEVCLSVLSLCSVCVLPSHLGGCFLVFLPWPLCGQDFILLSLICHSILGRGMVLRECFLLSAICAPVVFIWVERGVAWWKQPVLPPLV